MKENLTAAEFVTKPEVIDNCSCYMFYDWFCKDSSLKKRALSFVPKIKFLLKQNIIKPETKIWFKNNAPVYGVLYDFVGFKTTDGNAIGGICPQLGYNTDKKCEIWGFGGKDKELERIKFDDWITFKREIKTNEKVRRKIHRLLHD